MKVEFVNPFLYSLLDVLSTMAKIEAIASKPKLKKSSIACGEVTGLIAMKGEQTSGSLAISFEKQAIFNIAKCMLNEEFSIIDESVRDLVGEITNMVTGGAKRLLGDKGYHFDMSRPKVVSGDHHSIVHEKNGKNIIVEFTTDNGRFFVEVCF